MKIPLAPTGALVLAAVAVLGATPSLSAQDGPTWERDRGPTEAISPPFHATHLFDIPSSETVGGGELQFEIAHRFTSPISTDDSFFGLDGGASYRLGLKWGVTDRIQVGVVRSNVTDNTNLHAKARITRGASGPVTWGVAVGGGWAWNTEVFAAEDTETGQAHASLIVDLGVGDRVAVGASPSWVDNPDVLVDDEDGLFALPLRVQAWASDQFSVFGEWTLTDGSGLLSHDPAALGVQLETGGHFFTIGVTNGQRLNPSQYFTGAENPFALDELRLAFNITRRIAF